MEQLKKKPLGSDSAISRRLAVQESNPLVDLHNGLEALRDAPEDLKQQYAPLLIQAQIKAERGQRG